LQASMSVRKASRHKDQNRKQVSGSEKPEEIGLLLQTSTEAHGLRLLPQTTTEAYGLELVLQKSKEA